MYSHLIGWFRLLLIACLACGLAGCVYAKEKIASDERPVNAKAQPANLVNSAATLGRGDVFEVRVFKEKDLSSIYRISTKGTITFPLIGEVVVEGKTADQVEEEIRTRLEKDYLKSAYVSVFVKEFNSKKVFVFGQVQKPGTFPFDENMRIIQAITLAGGFNKTAAKNSVSITRIIDGKERRITVEVEEIWKGKQTNIQLKPGDIIFVPEALF